MKEILNILATFHDGGIEDVNGDNAELELKIGCAYLAEMEKEGFEYFFFTIKEVTLFEFHHLNGTVTKRLSDIIKLDIEIGYSKIEDGIVKIFCNVWTEKEGGAGGELWIKARFGSLKNHEMNQIEPRTLYEMSEAYWNSQKK